MILERNREVLCATMEDSWEFVSMCYKLEHVRDTPLNTVQVIARHGREME